LSLFLITCGGGGDGGTTGPTQPQLPTVQNIAFTTPEDIPKTFAFMGSEPQNYALTYSISTQPQHGTVSVSGGAATYTPNANYNGADTFYYLATSTSGNSNIGTVVATITPVDDEPNTMDVTATTDEDNAVDITLQFEEVDGDNIQFNVVNNPSNGNVTISGTTATYTPNQDWNGTDTFNFEVVDASSKSILNTATATITVNSINDAPVANSMSVSTNENRMMQLDITLDVTDVDGDNLTYAIVSDVSDGTTSLSGSTVTYTPNQDWNGEDTFTFKANDGTVDSNTATVTITVDAVNDAPVVSNVTASTDEDVTVNITLTGTDIEGDALTYSTVSNPSGGSVTISGETAAYTPNQDWNGVDTFTYQANDGELDSNIATATITVNQVFDDKAVRYISIQDTDYKNVDWVRMVQETSDGGFVILHPAKRIDNDSEQYPALTKTDSQGNVIWERVLGFVGQSATGGSVRETNDGGFIVAGFTNESNPQGLLIKTDSNGNSEWTQEYGNPNRRDMLYSVYVLANGYVANGETQSFSTGSSIINDIYTIMVDISGNQIWERGFGTGTFEHGPDNTQEYSFGANAIYSDGAFVFSAGTRLDQANSVYRGVFYKYDFNGTLLNSVYANTHSDVYSIHPGNGYIMAGGTASGESAWPSGTGVIHSFKYSSNLHVTNYHTAYSSLNSQSGYIHSSPTSDGGAIIVGDSINDDGEPQVEIVKIDASGNEQWTGNFSSDDSANEVGPVEADYGRFAIETSDGNYVVVGHSYHPHPSNDGWIYTWKTLFVKFDSNGQVIVERDY